MAPSTTPPAARGGNHQQPQFMSVKGGRPTWIVEHLAAPRAVGTGGSRCRSHRAREILGGGGGSTSQAFRGGGSGCSRRPARDLRRHHECSAGRWHGPPWPRHRYWSCRRSGLVGNRCAPEAKGRRPMCPSAPARREDDTATHDVDHRTSANRRRRWARGPGAVLITGNRKTAAPGTTGRGGLERLLGLHVFFFWAVAPGGQLAAGPGHRGGPARVVRD